MNVVLLFSTVCALILVYKAEILPVRRVVHVVALRLRVVEGGQPGGTPEEQEVDHPRLHPLRRPLHRRSVRWIAIAAIQNGSMDSAVQRLLLRMEPVFDLRTITVRSV
jgi:hypothetical protein